MTSSLQDPIHKAISVAQPFLEEGQHMTPDQIADLAEVAAATASRLLGVPVDSAVVASRLAHMVNVWVPSETTLADNADHVPWLHDRMTEIPWHFWDRYRDYLLNQKHWPRDVVSRLDQTTITTLALLEDPGRDGSWDRRGLVVGQVQSGKTANYTGLICRAVDAGYKLVIVLAGNTNALRSQTQKRLDSDFLGYESSKDAWSGQYGSRIGVGARRPLPDAPSPLHVNTLTNRLDNGDFNAAVAAKANVMLGQVPMLLVVKKWKTYLEHIVKWATHGHQSQLDPSSGRRVVRDVPLLLIDDEADHSSINTRDEEDPTAINRGIRDILQAFEKRAYVGYTATPFANIFIPPDTPHPDHGLDLFPRSFIVNLPTPSNHVGPAQVFGLRADHLSDRDSQPALPIVRYVDDYEDWVPDRHRSDLKPGPVPESLREAMLAFILSSAARQARAVPEKHNSMLIHVTRFTDVQSAVVEQVRDQLNDVRDRLRYGDPGEDQPILGQLRDLWNRDFLPSTGSFNRIWRHGDDFPEDGFDVVAPFLVPAAEKIAVRLINGDSKDSLIYDDYPEGLSVIAIGGDKLSRGLTLDGLSVSYYLRASRAYDTLMQMGRWFGYRPGYADLCRLYTTSTLAADYQDIAMASEELRGEFDRMAERQETPETFGLRVRTHPAGLMVTAANKMKHGVELKVTFRGTVKETTAFLTDPASRGDNLDQTAFLLQSLSGTPERHRASDNSTLVWRGQTPELVAQYLARFRVHPRSRSTRGDLLAEYIRQCVRRGELTNWTVALVSSGSPEARGYALAGHAIGLVTRSTKNNPELDGYARIGRLLSPSDEAIGCTPDELDAARALPGGKNAETNGELLRGVRSALRGLLLLYPIDASGWQGVHAAEPVIGFGVSFPGDDRAQADDPVYVVNKTYIQALLHDWDFDADGDAP